MSSVATKRLCTYVCTYKCRTSLEERDSNFVTKCHIYWIFIGLMKRLLLEGLKTSIMRNKNAFVKLWKDYNQGNLSAYDANLGCVEVKNRQIIEEQYEKRRKREN